MTGSAEKCRIEIAHLLRIYPSRSRTPSVSLSAGKEIYLQRQMGTGMRDRGVVKIRSNKVNQSI